MAKLPPGHRGGRTTGRGAGRGVCASVPRLFLSAHPCEFHLLTAWKDFGARVRTQRGLHCATSHGHSPLSAPTEFHPGRTLLLYIPTTPTLPGQRSPRLPFAGLPPRLPCSASPEGATGAPPAPAWLTPALPPGTWNVCTKESTSTVPILWFFTCGEARGKVARGKVWYWSPPRNTMSKTSRLNK